MMRAIVQRVHRAGVEVGGEGTGAIDRGLLVYVGVAEGDTQADARKLAGKVANLRIFDDAEGKMNLSVLDVGGGVLAISNFTVLADTRRGRRPAFVAAARPDRAEPLHECFLAALADEGCTVATGVFRTHMHIDSVADGPVNVTIDVPPPT
jgi:D-tyrosyl-tRNA(Tyr) deacylase